MSVSVAYLFSYAAVSESDHHNTELWSLLRLDIQPQLCKELLPLVLLNGTLVWVLDGGIAL